MTMTTMTVSTNLAMNLCTFTNTIKIDSLIPSHWARNQLQPSHRFKICPLAPVPYSRSKGNPQPMLAGPREALWSAPAPSGPWWRLLELQKQDIGGMKASRTLLAQVKSTNIILELYPLASRRMPKCFLVEWNRGKGVGVRQCRLLSCRCVTFISSFFFKKKLDAHIGTRFTLWRVEILWEI